MVIELREPHLVNRLEQTASERAQSVEQVLETAVQTYLDALDQEALHTETEAFWAMHETLVKQYAGCHVAMYRGQVVDSDKDVHCLEQRVRERFGAAPVLVAPAGRSIARLQSDAR